MSWDGKFKYEPMSPDKVKLIMDAYKNDYVYNYIMELYELINYQKDIINKQRVEIIALKHKEAWQRYDKNNPSVTKTLDKPKRSDTMGC
jgi:hypothetical protein